MTDVTADGLAQADSSANAVGDALFFAEIDITWQTRSTFVLDKNFIWNTGLLPLRWYRVQGCCSNISSTTGDHPRGCEIVGIQIDSDCSVKYQYVQNILAASVDDVCAILQDSGLNWQICSLKRFSNPADPRLVTDPTCNSLVEVPFCEYPNCIQFCLFADLVTTIGATTEAIDTIYDYTATGGATFYGSAEVEVVGGGTGVTDYSYISDGLPSILTGGSAGVVSSWESLLITESVANSSILSLEAIFGTNDGEALVLPSQFINSNCGGCTTMPNTIYLQNNILNQSVFNDFMQRNGFIFPAPITMHYSSRSQSWVGNIHYTGVGLDNLNSPESWRFVFEWACLNRLDGEDLGTSSWKFSMLAVRKRNGASDVDTRIMIVFPPNGICFGAGNLGFNFSFILNTITDYVNGSVVPNVVLLNDKIGLFKSKYWSQYPNLSLKLSQSNTVNSVQRQDIYPIFPQAITQ